MAGQMIETWMGELTKIGRNVAANKASFAKTKGVANASTHQKKDANLIEKSRREEKHELLASKIEEEKDQKIAAETCTLSESTMCLLLDRFVPC